MMKSRESLAQAGQGLVEYSLILLLVALAVTLLLVTLGPQVGNTYSKVGNKLSFGRTTATAGSTPTPGCNGTGGVPGIAADMEQRTMTYYKKYGSWPRSWSPYNYTDIGLTPSDWSGPVDCVYWGPNASSIGLANKSGDNIQLYVQDLHGNTLHLYDGWNIWCVASTAVCYYHTVATGNEVNISTLTATAQ